MTTLEKIEFHEGDVWVLDMPSGTNPDSMRRTVERISRHLDEAGLTHVLILIKNRSLDLRQISETEMAAMGWVRRDA